MAYTSEIEKLEARFRENPKGRNFAPLADAYRKAGLIDNAVDLCENGLKLHPDYVSAHIVYGRCRLDKKDDPGAQAVFRKVLELDPENVIALKNLGEIAERNGRFGEAVDWVTRLLAADPMNGDAAESLARVKGKASTQGVADAPTTPMEQPAFVVEHTSVSQPTPVAAVPPSQRNPDVETFDGSLDFNPAAHAAAKAEGLEVQEDVELNSQQVEHVEVEGLARTQYEGSGMFRLDSGPAEAPAPAQSPVPELVDEGMPQVDLPLIMPDDLPPAPEVPAAPARVAARPSRIPAPIPAAVVLSDDDGAADTAVLSRAEPVLTETMAELYLKQGHQQDALRVYQALLAQRPGDARLRRKVEQLSGGGGRGGGGRKSSGVSAQAFLKGVLAGRGAAARAPRPPQPPRPPAPPPPPPPPPPAEAAPTTLEGAFDATPESDQATGPPPGHPTHPADDHISLDAVFGDEASRRSSDGVAAPDRPAPSRADDGGGKAPAPGGGGFSFDDFFGGSGGGGGGTSTASTPAQAPESGPRASARASGRAQRPPENEGDLDQFQQWLKKLKS